MSTRWSYGPDGLRERPVTRWSDAELLPRWRDLQPLLIRSAGVVGLVATILAVVSSDALRFGADAPPPGRAGESAELTTAMDTPVVAAASELRAEVAPEPIASARMTMASVDATAPQAATIETLAPPVLPAAPELQAERVPEPAASAPTTIASVHEPAGQATTSETHAPPIVPEMPDLRTERTLVPATSAAPLTTASVPDPEAAKAIGGPMIAVHDAPATIPVATLASADETGLVSDTVPSIWTSSAAICPRDWVSAAQAEGSELGSADCAATAELIASVADADQTELEEAAAEHAQNLALAPRIPLPRPDIVPVVKPVRVSRSSSWPAEPPPNCGAGQHAKWHFVDRKAGTKEWYCK